MPLPLHPFLIHGLSLLLLQLSISHASTDIPIARHYRAFGPLPYTSAEKGVDPLSAIPSKHSILDTLLSLDSFPSESAVGGSATWRECPYNASAKGVITAPFPDADPHLPYDAWAVANFSISHDLQRPHLLQCSNPATIRVQHLVPDYQSKLNLTSTDAVTECPEDVYEDGRSLCVVRLWPGSYQIFVQLSSMSNTTSFFCNFFIEPANLTSNLLLPIDDTVTPSIIVQNKSHQLGAQLAGPHCSVTIMNAHHREWATGGTAQLIDAPSGLKLAPQSRSDAHYPLPRIAPRQIRQLRLDLLTEPTFLQHTMSETLPNTINVTVAVTYQVDGKSHRSSFHLALEVNVWGILRSYHFTYIDVDGSIQAAAVLPPNNTCVGAPAGDNACSILLSTHGAGVDAVGRAWTESYRTQNQSWVLLPTGRRKFGLNWEGPQMKSALTSLQRFAELLPGVPKDEKELWKVHGDRWLQAGHSMGGHGALLLSTHYPDCLLASVPAMGWLRLNTYSERSFKEQLPYSDAASRALLTLASSEYNTDLYSENLLGIPFLARVGSDDDNVPPSNLRRFCRLLKQNEFFNGLQPSAVALSEVPGKGHWFDGVVDDDELQPFIQKHLKAAQKPPLPKRFTLMTMNPASTGSRGGFKILSLEVVFQISRLRIERDSPVAGTWKVATANVRRFRYQPVLGMAEKPDLLEIDNSSLLLSVRSVVIGGRTPYIDFCASSPAADSAWDARLVDWRPCPDSGSWANERTTERGPDTSGPASQVLAERRVAVVFPEGDNELRDTAVAYSNALYIRGISVQVTTDSNVSIGQLESSGDANIVLLGGPDINRMSRRRYSDGFSADVSFTENKFCISSLKCFEAPGTGIAFLSAGPKRTLLFYVAGTDRDGLVAALSFLPYGPSSQVPEWVIVSKDRGWGFRGLGGVVGMGYWDHSWRLEVRKSYPAEFAFDVKRSGMTCTTKQSGLSLLWYIALFSLPMFALLICFRKAKSLRQSYYSVPQADTNVEGRGRREVPPLKEKEGLLDESETT